MSIGITYSLGQAHYFEHDLNTLLDNDTHAGGDDPDDDADDSTDDDGDDLNADVDVSTDDGDDVP